LQFKPAAGPDTLYFEPLKIVTNMPPITPAIIPENNGTLHAIAIP
jgi:hypothetical protein